MYLICHLTSDDPLIERACKFMGRSSLCYIITLIIFVAISIMMVEICFLICHVTSPKYMLKRLFELMGGSPMESHHLAMFGCHWSNAN